MFIKDIEGRGLMMGGSPLHVGDKPVNIVKRLLHEQVAFAAKKYSLPGSDLFLKLDTCTEMRHYIYNNLVSRYRNSRVALELPAAFGAMTMLHALEHAFVFIVDLEMVKQSLSDELVAGVMSSFKMPCDSVVMLIKDGDGYADTILLCYYCGFDYNNGAKSGKTYEVQSIKIVKDYSGWQYVTTASGLFIPVIAPRLVLMCGYESATCSSRTKTEITKHVIDCSTSEAYPNTAHIACLKSLRTIATCSGVTKKENARLYLLTIALCKALEAFYNRVSVSRQASVSKNIYSGARPVNNQQSAYGYSAERTIDLTKPIVEYRGAQSTGRHHSKHASPRQHIRKSHVRRLKDGRVVVVRETIINRGKSVKKVDYEV
jgi:hypothetical protein